MDTTNTIMMGLAAAVAAVLILYLASLAIRLVGWFIRQVTASVRLAWEELRPCRHVLRISLGWTLTIGRTLLLVSTLPLWIGPWYLLRRRRHRRFAIREQQRLRDELDAEVIAADMERVPTFAYPTAPEHDERAHLAAWRARQAGSQPTP